MMLIYKEYKESLKKIEVEEIVDLLIFRPVAFALVKILYRTSLTPNQISFIAMLLGAVAGGFLAWGSRIGFLTGALIFLASHIFDCSDGMIARLKNNGTKIGRVIDGISDYFTFTFVYLGAAIGLSRMEGNNLVSFPVSVWLVVAVIIVFHIIHSIITDYYRNKYLFNVYDFKIDPKTQKEEFETEYAALEKIKGRWFEKLVVQVYLKYTMLQSAEIKGLPKKYDSEAYALNNRVLIQLWNLIGNSTHILAFAVSAIIFIPWVYVLFAVVFANIWMLVLFIVQHFVNKRTKVQVP